MEYKRRQENKLQYRYPGKTMDRNIMDRWRIVFRCN